MFSPSATWAAVTLLAGVSLAISIALIPAVSLWIRQRYIKFVQTAMATTEQAGRTDGHRVQDDTAAVTPSVHPLLTAEQLLARGAAATRGAARSYVLAGLTFGMWSAVVVGGSFLLGTIAGTHEPL